MESRHTGPISAVNLSSKPSLNSIDIVLVLFLTILMPISFPPRQAADLRSIRDRLAVHFGKIPIEDRPYPVSQFIGSFTGSRTYDWKSRDAFVRLMGRYPSWDAIADAPIAD